MWNLKKKKVELIEAESRIVVARGWGCGNEKRLVKGYKLSVTRRIRSEDLMDIVVTVGDNCII